jgi:polyribonucleotide nucleotidyltransferase
MDGGVPIKDMVSGVAMGLIKDSSGNCHIFTDISGSEDAFGLMDFKVTGTETGVMAIQMDIKDKVGLTRELLGQALEQARVGRLHILNEMKKTMKSSRENVADHAPRVTFLRVPQDKIGAIIGPGGKNIKDIIARTGAQIDIEDDGTVRVYAKDQASGDAAAQIIKTIVGDVEVGAEFQGIVRRYAEFGMFVELVPGKDGLIHISTIAKDKQRDIEKYAPLNGTLLVKVVAYDPESGRIRLVAPELEGDGGSNDSDDGYERRRR